MQVFWHEIDAMDEMIETQIELDAVRDLTYNVLRINGVKRNWWFKWTLWLFVPKTRNVAEDFGPVFLFLKYNFGDFFYFVLKCLDFQLRLQEEKTNNLWLHYLLEIKKMRGHLCLHSSNAKLGIPSILLILNWIDPMFDL